MTVSANLNSIEVNGAEVTDFHLEKMPRSEYAPMACVG